MKSNYFLILGNATATQIVFLIKTDIKR